MRLEDKIFLVRINQDWLVREVDGREVRAVAIPSAALRLAYRQADELCQVLRRGRYPGAIVVNEDGVPVSLADLHSDPTPAPSPLPRSMSDLDAIPVRELRKRIKSDPTFAQHVADLYARAGRPQ
jgi:hypothetical protein